MSRIGYNPIQYNPTEISLALAPEKNNWGGKTVIVTAKTGEFRLEMRPEVELNLEVQGTATFSIAPKHSPKESKKFLGLYRTLLANKIQGALKKFVKELEIVGIGYKAELQGDKLKLNIGYTTPQVYNLPTGIEAKVTDQVFIAISGHDKEVVGETAAQIRRIRKPEPYKGKGIRYKNEVIKRKAGKTAA